MSNRSGNSFITWCPSQVGPEVTLRFGRGPVCFQLHFPWHRFLSLFFSFFSPLLFHLHLFFPVSSNPLSFLPFSFKYCLCDLGFIFFGAYKSKGITSLPVGITIPCDITCTASVLCIGIQVYRNLLHRRVLCSYSLVLLFGSLTIFLELF